MADAIFICAEANPLDEIRNAGPGRHFAAPGRGTFFASIRPRRWRGTTPPPDFDSRPPGVDFMSWTPEPGDCAVRHVRTRPGGGGNPSSQCRDLPDGDPLPSEAFPLVSPKELCR